MIAVASKPVIMKLGGILFISATATWMAWLKSTGTGFIVIGKADVKSMLVVG